MKKIVGYDSWKRPIYKDVESLPNYPKKEKVIYNTFDNLPNATPQEIKGGMLLSFFLIDRVF